MLLPNGVRVVIEIDGKQHYADASGYAEPSKYAATMAADRELQLAGYHVFHFGAAELVDERSVEKVRKFFADLFAKFGVSY
jgi:very-short-patch-repair endonuclease